MSNVTPIDNPTLPLKPGRIGFRLRKLPDWELATESGSIFRTFRFQRTETAQAFASYAALMARDHGQRPSIAQCWSHVTVTLPAAGGLTEAMIDFAERLMLLPESDSEPGGTSVPVPGGPGPVVQPTPVAQPTPQAQPFAVGR